MSKKYDFKLDKKQSSYKLYREKQKTVALHNIKMRQINKNNGGFYRPGLYNHAI